MPFKDKEARNAYNKEYKAKKRLDPEFRKLEREKERKLYEQNKEKTLQYRLEKNAKYRESHRAELAEKERKRIQKIKSENPEEYAKQLRDRSKAFRDANKENPVYKEAIRQRSAAWYAKKKDDTEFKAANVARVKKWIVENREIANERSRKRNAKRYSFDIQFKIAVCLRRRLYMAVKGNHRSGLAVKELGCSIEEFKIYIESKFLPGMSWDTWSKNGWHIDHIKPLNSFDLTDQEEVKKACHYTNLQPLWAFDNCSKGSKYMESQAQEFVIGSDQ